MGFATVIGQALFFVIFIIAITYISASQYQAMTTMAATFDSKMTSLQNYVQTTLVLNQTQYISAQNRTLMQIRNTGGMQIPLTYSDVYIDGARINRSEFGIYPCATITNATCGELVTTFDTVNALFIYHLNNDSYYGENSTLVDDFSINALHANQTNTISIAGKFGNATYFNGSAFISRGYNSRVNFTTLRNYTVSMWVYQESTISGTLFSHKNLTSGFALRINRTAIIVNANNTEFTVQNNLTNNTWNHVALTFNFLNVFNVSGVPRAHMNMTLYINTTILNNDTTSGVNIGRDVFTNSSFLIGAIDEVAYYNQSRNATDIRQLYNKGYELLNPGIWDASESAAIIVNGVQRSGNHVMTYSTQSARQISDAFSAP
jgi:archaellum component FlaF (FlaF/FlaG flagellin family)